MPRTQCLWNRPTSCSFTYKKPNGLIAYIAFISQPSRLASRVTNTVVTISLQSLFTCSLAALHRVESSLVPVSSVASLRPIPFMMRSSSACQLSVLTAIAALVAACSSYPTIQSPKTMGGVVMRPIHINDYEAATGLRRRASEDFSDLDLQTQSQLIYGSAGGKSKIVK